MWLPCVRGVEQYRDVREPKFKSRIGMVGIKSVFRRATLRITNGDVSLESSMYRTSYLLPIVFYIEINSRSQKFKMGSKWNSNSANAQQQAQINFGHSKIKIKHIEFMHSNELRKKLPEYIENACAYFGFIFTALQASKKLFSIRHID